MTREKENVSEEEMRPKKPYVKPVYQKHETLKVAAAATYCPGPGGSGGS